MTACAGESGGGLRGDSSGMLEGCLVDLSALGPWPLGSLARPQRADVQGSPLHENVYVDDCKEDGARRYQERTLLSSGCSLLPSIRICVDNPARWASSFEVPEDTVLTSLSPVQRREQTELGRGSNRGGTRQHLYQQRVSGQTVRLRATKTIL